jgi:hypothetical protein
MPATVPSPAQGGPPAIQDFSRRFRRVRTLSSAAASKSRPFFMTSEISWLARILADGPASRTASSANLPASMLPNSRPVAPVVPARRFRGLHCAFNGDLHLPVEACDPACAYCAGGAGASPAFGMYRSRNSV